MESSKSFGMMVARDGIELEALEGVSDPAKRESGSLLPKS